MELALTVLVDEKGCGTKFMYQTNKCTPVKIYLNILYMYIYRVFQEEQ